MLSVSRNKVGVALSLAVGLLVVPLPALAVQVKPNLQVKTLTSSFLTEEPNCARLPAPCNEPKHLLPGDSITVQAIVWNKGTAATALQQPDQSDNVTKFFLKAFGGSSKKNLNGLQIIKTPLAVDGEDGEFESDGVTPRLVELFIYSDTVPGEYQIMACADAVELIAELAEGDNCTTTTGTLIVDEGPDLKVTQLKTPSLPSGKVGLGGSFQVENTVANVGRVAADAPTITTYSLVSANDPTVIIPLKGPLDHVLADGSSVPAPPVPALDASGDPNDSVDQREMVTVRAVDPATPVGPYKLRACADGKKTLREKDNDNNCLTASGTFNVVESPNLQVTFVELGPVTLTEPLAITAKVKNVGGAAAVKSKLKVVLLNVNTDPPVEENLKVNSAGIEIPALAVGQESDPILSGDKVTLYATTPPGTYKVQVCADKDKVVAEAVESDNCKDTAQLVTVPGVVSDADLEVQGVFDLACSPGACTNAVPGSLVEATVHIVNSGTDPVEATADTPLAVNIKLVKGSLEKSLKYLNGSNLIKATIAPGAVVILPVEAQIAAETLAGTYAVRFCADETKQFPEADDNNNCMIAPECSDTKDTLTTSNTPNAGNACPGFPLGCTFGGTPACTKQFHQVSPGQITVSTSGANLQVLSISNPPSTSALGATFAMTIQVKNVGIAAADASRTKYSLVTLATPPTTVDLKSPSGNTVGALGVNKAVSSQETLTIPLGTPVGEYKGVQACADGDKLVSESVETDNCKISSGRIQ